MQWQCVCRLGVLLLCLAPLAMHGAAPPTPLSAAQKAKLAERDVLEKQLPALIQQQQFDKVIDALEKIAALEKAALGATHGKAIGSLQYLADWLDWREQFARAIRVRQEVMRLQELSLGKDHWEATDARLALQHSRLLAGLDAAQRAQVGQALEWELQATHLSQQGRFPAAVELKLQVCAVRRKVLGQRHPHYASSLITLAALYQAMGEHGKALPLFLEGRDLYRKVLGEKHPHYATSLNNLAGLYEAMGKHGKALPLSLEARDLYRKVLGEKHPHYAASLNNLAMLYQAMGEPAKALPLCLETRNLCRQILGEKHPHYALSLNNLASLHQAMEEYGKALPLFLEARDLFRKVLGEKHPRYAASLSNLGNVYNALGEPGKALPLFLEARDLFRKVLGEKHPRYAASLSNLGNVYNALGEPGKALPLFLEARDLRRKVLGEKHPDYAESLHILAMLYKNMGEHDKALPLYLEARDLRRKVLGEKHPLYARSQNSLANFYHSMREYDKALPLYLEARDLFRKVLGEKHPEYANSLNSLAWLYQATGKPTEVLAASQQALRVLDDYLEEGYDHLGELQRTQLIQNVLHNLGILLSLHEQAGQPLAQAYAAVLNWKGRVAARQSLDRLMRDRPEFGESLQRLQTLRGRLARLGLQTPLPHQHAAWLTQLKTLSQEKELLEADLSRRSSELRRDKERRRLTAAQLSKEVPADVAFIDLLDYSHYSPPAKGKGRPQLEMRLLAFVVRRGQEPVAVSLGATKPIADAVRRWRSEVDKSPSQANRAAVAKAGQTLRQRVWLKLKKHLGGAKTVVLAPDGVLCEFPFAALPGETPGSYLLEEVAIAQVASAQQLFDLVQPVEKPRAATRGLLDLGGVDYGVGKTYDSLPGTKAEVERCRGLFRQAFPLEPTMSLTGKAATVQAVQQAVHEKRPRFLHLATHGYFEPPERVERLLKGLAASKDGLALWREQTTTLERLPGLRCGLALAGANLPPPVDDATGLRGILTGEDLAGLDLRGCELAVLSACQTGLGDVKGSQGVLGLQRSFHAAGVQTLLSSLWSVSDAATMELMDEFYSRLWGKEKMSRLEALRQAQLAILRHPERVRKRTELLLVDAKKRGVSAEVLRGIKGKLATDLPEGGKIEEAGKRSPEAWWAAFVLSGDWR